MARKDGTPTGLRQSGYPGHAVVEVLSETTVTDHP
jgi:hypothetical protein